MAAMRQAMQGNWVDMVYGQEVPPPAGVWDAIAMTLEEAQAHPSWQQRVYHAEEMPPAESWQQVAAALDRQSGSGWLGQLYHREEMPPAESWQQVAATLDRQSGSGWLGQLYHREEMPPAESWQQVAAALDRQSGSGWLGQLYHREEMPPAESWQQVAATLDRQSGSGWLGQLYHREEMPPADAWQIISASLEERPSETVPSRLPVRRMNTLRMAAAAAVLVAVAGTVWWAANRPFSDNVPQSVAVNAPAASTTAPFLRNEPPSEASPLDMTSTPSIDPLMDNEATATRRYPRSKPLNSVAMRTVATGETTEYAPGNDMAFLSTDAVLQNTRKLPNDRGETLLDINGLEVANSQYVTISGPDGRSMRVSAKFTNLLGYLHEGANNEERLDRIIRESAVWKATFRQWREKMSHVNATPSLNNFMDVVELAKMLQ